MKRISDEYSPVRKSQTVYGSISVNYAFRGEKTIWCESTLERDFLIKQEFNSNVIDIVSQPITIPLMCAEKTGGFNLVNYRHSSGVYHEQETEDLHRRI